jgi:hypothetical protein
MDFGNKLHEDFPLMYPDGADVWVGEGWYPIVRKLSHAIQNYIDQWNKRNEYLRTRGGNGVDISDLQDVVQVTVAQVKEKFGGLRFYYEGGDDYIAGLVEMAEIWAENTCEVCGEHGNLRGDLSWIRTLCDEHYEEHKEKSNFIPHVDSTPDPAAV